MEGAEFADSYRLPDVITAAVFEISVATDTAITGQRLHIFERVNVWGFLSYPSHSTPLFIDSWPVLIGCVELHNNSCRREVARRAPCQNFHLTVFERALPDHEFRRLRYRGGSWDRNKKSCLISVAGLIKFPKTFS